uniref:FAM65 N-terminal domain-containing protein n=1 Tax=Panagrolaimus sp. JU765 TaxID=591449 RepID=A0AC34RIF0_9BILA
MQSPLKTIIAIWNKIFRSSCTKLSAVAESASVEQVIQRLIKGFKSYHEFYLSEITRLQELLTSLAAPAIDDGKDEAQTEQKDVSQTSTDQNIEKEAVSHDLDSEIERVKNELALAEENKELYETRGKLVESLLRKYEEHRAKFSGSKPNKSESLGDLRPIGQEKRTIQAGNSTITLKYKGNLDHTETISGLTYQSPLINHRAKIFEKKRADQAMAEIRMEMMGMLGRISIELKAIVGFARITTGDTFEVVIKHDGQKWKSRGKTLQDRSQNWEQTHTLMNIMADSPIFIKVFEIKLFRNHLLSERTFEPSDFFNAQPQLVTMNLHPLGTIKLQLVVTWIPLLSSKSGIRTLGNSQSASLLRNHSKVGDSALSHSVSMGAQPNQPLSAALVTNFNGESCASSKVVLRQKKRQRQLSNLKDMEKDNRRSSTAILDNMYREFSKSIPTIDDLTGLKTLSNSKQNLHKSGASESHINPPVRYSANVLKPASWSRSISMNHLAEIDNNKLVAEKKAASLLRKDRGGFLSSKRTAESDDSSDTSSQIASVTRSAEGLKKVDALLEYVDKLRVYLSVMRSSEYTELTAFEACMLNWEAVLKLNRATMLEDQRTAQKGSQRRSASSGNKKIEKRSSMYNQHSPSNISDELDDNVLMNSNDQVSENDSGIDSLRQHVSPYNSKIMYQQQKHHQHIPQSHHPIPIAHNLQQLNYGTTGRTGSGPAQRRFKQFKERRKSLGIVLDSMTAADYERIVLNSDKFWEPQANAAVAPQVAAMASALGAEFTQTASGNAEVDNCLKHHLKRAIVTLEILQKLEGPLEYRLTEMLCRMEQDTVALEELLNISDTLPALPNITNLLADLGANSELQEIWLSTSYPLNSFVMVPTEHLQRQIKAYLLPIVQVRYPRLINNVLENVMNLLVKNGDWEPDKISLFQFVGLFRGKHLTPFIENLAHESWITSNLTCTKPDVVKEVMDRLKNVPVVPPLESLRHIGLCLLRENKEITAAIDSYLRTARTDLANDLTACFVCLLEHKDSASRQGACRALTILQQESVIEPLQYVASEDEDKAVREAAKEALDSLGCICHDYEEVTKV